MSTNTDFRTCPTTGLKVDLAAEKLIKANAVAAVVFLAVGGLFGLTGQPIPDTWTRPWGGRIGTGIAGMGEVCLDDVVARTTTIAQSI